MKKNSRTLFAVRVIVFYWSHKRREPTGSAGWARAHPGAPLAIRARFDGGATLADDFVQATFVRALERADQYVPGKKGGPVPAIARPATILDRGWGRERRIARPSRIWSWRRCASRRTGRRRATCRTERVRLSPLRGHLNCPWKVAPYPPLPTPGLDRFCSLMGQGAGGSSVCRRFRVPVFSACSFGT
jgi:hypothetical protein